MARIRTVKPEFADSESMGRVSRDARLLFVLMWTIADDAGRLRGAPRYLASKAFPYDEDAPDLVVGWLAELEREQCIRRYVVEGSQYLEIINWAKHQRIERPSDSKVPAPDDSPPVVASPREDSRAVGEPSPNDHRTLADAAPSDPRTVAEASPPRARALDLDLDQERDHGPGNGSLRVAEPPPELSTAHDAPLNDAAPRRPQDEMFDAVCEACGLDTTLLDSNTRIAAAKLARELLQADDPWTPEEVRQAGEDWYGVRWKGRQRSQVSPPQVRQLKTWLGQCEEQRRKHEEYAWAVQR